VVPSRSPRLERFSLLAALALGSSQAGCTRSTYVVHLATIDNVTIEGDRKGYIHGTTGARAVDLYCTDCPSAPDHGLKRVITEDVVSVEDAIVFGPKPAIEGEELVVPVDMVVGRRHLEYARIHIPRSDVVESHEHVAHERGFGGFILGWGVLLGGFGATGIALTRPSTSDAIVWGIPCAVGLVGVVAGVYSLLASDYDRPLVR
jgi:hypothetical protein